LLEEDETAEMLDSEITRVELYKKAVTNQLIGIVNAIETIQRQQRKVIHKSKQKRST